MKKIKILPSMLMLVACIAVLCVGVFAISPTKNTISGTLTINASNNHLILTVYKTSAVNEDGTEATQNKLVGPLDARAGVKLQIAEALAFDTAKANTKEEVKPVVLVIKIENKTNNELGAYFYNGEATDTMPEVATEENVRTSYMFKADQTDADEDALINTTFSGYKLVAPCGDAETGEPTYMKITFSLNKFEEYTSNFNFPLNIENYNSNLDNSILENPGLMFNISEKNILNTTTISKDASNPTTFAGEISEQLGGESIGFTNLIYSPSNTKSVTTLSSETGELPVKFQFDITYNSKTYKEQMGMAEDEEIKIEDLHNNLDTAILLLFPCHIFSFDEFSSLEVLPFVETQEAVASGSTITVYETEGTAGITEFCLMYVSFEDLQITLATPTFQNEENLYIKQQKSKISSYDKLINNGQTATINYSMVASEDENISKKVNISTSRINKIPQDVKAVNIYANVAEQNMYLIESNYYNSLQKTMSLSQIIEQIKLGNDSSNQNKYVSVGFATEDQNTTMFEIPTYWCTAGSLNFVTILLSESQDDLQVNYFMEHSNTVISDPLIYELTEDASGNYYSVLGMISSKIDTVVVPATYNSLPVTQILSNAFANTNLQNITLSEGLIKINAVAFSNTKIKSIAIPSTVVEIDSTWLFSKCSNLETIVVNPNNPIYTSGEEGTNAIINKTTNELIVGCKNTTIPNTVVKLGSNSFQDCIGLTKITIPESVEVIGQYAFDGCINLKQIFIPKKVKMVSSDAFDSCSALESIVVDPENKTYTSANGANAIIEISSNILILGCKQTIIPQGTTAIGNHAFNGCSGLTTINIPNSVTEIGSYAFYNCCNLANIVVPESVKMVDWRAFVGLANNAYTIENGIKYIKSPTNNYYVAADYTPQMPANVTLNQNTKIICGTFDSCKKLESITIPAGVIYIGYMSFGYCDNLTTVIIQSSQNNSSLSISYSAFSNCHNLTTVVLRDGLKIIDQGTFYNCSNLQTITIPESVTNLIGAAFYGCDSLIEMVFLPKVPPTLAVGVIPNNIQTIYVPKNCKSAYIADPNWLQFESKIVELKEDGTKPE